MDRSIDWLSNKFPWFHSSLPILTFIWIWALTFVFFIKGIDIYGVDVSIIKIVYVTFALICIISFQFSREIWQKMITRFWIFVIVYSVFDLFISLLFQFNSVQVFFKHMHIDSKWQSDIGLQIFGLNQLITFFSLDIAFIIMAIVLRLFLKKTNLVATIRLKFIEKMVEVLDTFFDITKLTVFGIIMSCIYKVNFMNFFIILAAVVSMILSRTFRYVIIQLISICAAVILLSQMVMQLQNIWNIDNATCAISSNMSITVNRGAWLGLGKIESGETIFSNVIGYICIIVLVTVYTVVIKEENIIEKFKQNAGWSPEKMFNDVTYHEADKDFISFIKYILKYGFYRYGTEFTYICIALLIQARLDVWALIYSIWLMVFILCSSQKLPTVWMMFKYFMVICIPLQYLMAVGFSPTHCFGFYYLYYDGIVKNMLLWLHLPVGTIKPDSYKLVWDAIVFLFALCQANVFEFERKGEQNEFFKTSPKIDHDSAFVTKPRTTFGFLRYALFCSLPLISACSFFLAATSTITIFSIGYGIGFTLILWFADNYFLRSSSQTMLLWKYLLIFSVIMLFIKTILQIPACIFMDYLVPHSCWLVQLLGISCLRMSTKTLAFWKVPIWSAAEIQTNSCWDLPTTIGIEWDICCFISLMFHKRFLQSNYFIKMAKEADLNAKFSNKAAKILEELNEEEIRDLREKYLKNLDKIQKNMVRLKEAQKRIQGIKISEPTTHQEAVTSGDYYMFQDSDKNVKLSTEEEGDQKSSDELDETPQTPSVGKFMETVLKTDIEQAIKLSDAPSLVSEKSSKSSKSKKSSIEDSPKDDKCYKCECSSQEAFNLRIELAKGKLLDEEKKSKDSETVEIKKEGVDSKIKKRTRSSSVVLKDDKLQPTVDFRQRKSTDQQTDKKEEPKKIVVCDCGCKDCKCRKKFRNAFLSNLCLGLKFSKAFINSCMSSLIQIFNKLAHDYKHISKQLEKEKDVERFRQISPSSSLSLVMSDQSTSTPSRTKSTSSYHYQIPIYVRLLISFYEMIMSHFNTVCFLSVLLLQMKNPTIFCLPLTMMVLFWGSLSVPRPTKRFWKIIIAYTIFLLLLECVVRSQLVQYDQRTLYSKSYQINQLFGIEKSENHSVYYLIVILAVFLQRRLLINIGLWPIEPPIKKGRNFFSTGFVSVKHFFRKLSYERYNRIPVDVYTHIFICDFINIFVFIFGFASVTEKRDEGVSRYFSENKIPPAMLVIFILQCSIMFIDRWIYLRRHVIAKLIFQFVQIILIHFCLFLLLPAATFRRFNQLFFPSLWYIIKSIYFLLSAYQIRCGYPGSVHGHALCQSYNVVNMYLYQFYLIFPFVYELRTITDWMWTETTLTMSEWIGMEDIFCTVFQLKCWRNYDNKYSYLRGQKITSTVKFVEGGGVVLLFFLILLFPLAFFAFGRAAGKVNLPHEMEIKFRLGYSQPLFSAITVDIQSLTVSQWLAFKDIYKYYPEATNFLSDYYAEDVGVIRFSGISTTRWQYSPGLKESLISDLESGRSLTMVSEWVLYRKTENVRQSTVVNGFHSVSMSNNSRNSFLQLLHGMQYTFFVDNISPKFLQVSSEATTSPVEALMISYDDYTLPPYANLTFEIDTINKGDTMWWQAYERYTAKNLIRTVDSMVAKNSKEIVIFTFNDKIFPPGIFSYVSAQGIIGLYTTFLISLGLIIRRLCRGRTNQVFLDYLPNVDSIIQLLLDIYFVRENKDGKLEEDLYAKLIFLFRSPETLIRWTRMPKDSD